MSLKTNMYSLGEMRVCIEESEVPFEPCALYLMKYIVTTNTLVFDNSVP